ncbi:MAG: hypothetical protein B6I22_06270 [Desulfobacteraceae bacterium 4572_123]|nr:MAG: hypothetical protein B6I22_06270 [Desulfobacteraceae bacterium 4572_123]
MTGLTVIGGIVFFCLGVYLFYYAMKRIKMGRQIKDTQKSNIVSLKPGLVEIQGKVEADDAISSPYSNTACVHYRFSATKRQRRPSSDSHILQDIEIGSGRKGVPFFLRDDTGRVIIDPEEAEILEYKHGKVFKSESGKSASLKERMKKLKAADKDKYSKTSKPRPFFRKMDSGTPLDIPDDLVEIEAGSDEAKHTHKKYHESWIQEDDDLFVFGNYGFNPKKPGTFCMQKSKGLPFIISGSKEYSVLSSFKREVKNGFLVGTACIGIGVLLFLIGIGSISG